MKKRAFIDEFGQAPFAYAERLSDKLAMGSRVANDKRSRQRDNVLRYTRVMGKRRHRLPRVPGESAGHAGPEAGPVSGQVIVQQPSKFVGGLRTILVTEHWRKII